MPVITQLRAQIPVQVVWSKAMCLTTYHSEGQLSWGHKRWVMTMEERK